MFSRRLKAGYFVIEGLNSFATVYYFYYFYFLMQKQFGFDNKANLALAALNGATYALASWWGGKFAQRFGYFRSLKFGFVTMMAALALGSQLTSAPGQIAVMVLTVVGMSFTWPTLEALISEGESQAGLQQMVGIYNVVWAGTAAIGNFSGGAMLEHLGFQSLFFVPIAIQLTQLSLTFWLESLSKKEAHAGGITAVLEKAPRQAVIGESGGINLSAPLGTAAVLAAETGTAVTDHQTTSRAKAKTFLNMAWLANPFAYIAINTLIAVIPGVAERLKLSTMLAGFCCSVWCFARFGAFFVLWHWSGWHYRFRWLLLAYLGLVGSFVVTLTATSLTTLVLAQIVFGCAIGLLYYSSLFYSMDNSEAKGEHGGIHEAAIGLGNFAGPAVGAMALQFLPGSANNGALAVGVLLLCGLGGLLTIWKTGKS